MSDCLELKLPDYVCVAHVMPQSVMTKFSSSEKPTFPTAAVFLETICAKGIEISARTRVSVPALPAHRI